MSDRIFLGIPLTIGSAGQLSDRLDVAFPRGLPGRRVPSENWHLTLRFLGNVAPDSVARLRRELGREGLGGPFEITFGALGAFPRPKRARVIWLGVTRGEEPLQRLAATVESRVRAAGLPPEDRPFSPHLTLSRLRDPSDVARLIASPRPPVVALPVHELVLFRSHLGAGPPRYEAVERFPL